MDILTQLNHHLGADRVQTHQPLAPVTTFKVGGPAEYGFTATSTGDLIEAAWIGRKSGLSITVLGRGANVLIHDQGIDGLVIINRAADYELSETGRLDCDSGCDTAMLMSATEQAGWMGFERLLKVPGTVGGAIFMNAGDTGRQSFIGQLVTSVIILNSDGTEQELTQADCDFEYRHSRFQQTDEMIVRASFQLEAATPEQIASLRGDILARKTKQPPGANCGSTFRNPPGDFAGRLIEAAGLKGAKIGGASVSTSHANFIINDGTATANDIAQLIDLIQQQVSQQSGVKLVEEVCYLGDWDS